MATENIIYTNDVTVKKTLNVGFTNSENKLEYLKVPNPATREMTEAKIREVANYLVTNQVLIDNYGEVISDTSQVTTAYTEFNTVTDIDLVGHSSATPTPTPF